MESWMTIKVKFTKEFSDGTLKRVTEPYLVSAMSFSEAEARIYKEVGEFCKGEFSVVSIAKTDFADIFMYDDIDIWYKCVVAYVSEDEASGKEKKIKNNYLVSAHNVKQAYERIEESLHGLMVSYDTPTISETAIVEIFPFESSVEDEATPAEPEATPSTINVAADFDDEEGAS